MGGCGVGGKGDHSWWACLNQVTLRRDRALPSEIDLKCDRDMT